MLQYLFDQFKESNGVKLSLFAFVALTTWWLTIYFRGLTEGPENDFFTYLLLFYPLVGGVAGLLYSRLWGGFKSLFGRTILLFSLGLFLNFIGNVIFLYYIYALGIEVPYPSVGDIAFYGSVIFYIFGSYQLARTLSVSFKAQPLFNKVVSILIPIIIVLLSYVLMRDYDFAESTPLLILMDFGWQIFQGIYVSIALYVYWGSRKVLGGIMRQPIVLLIAALVLQFIADFHFSYQVNQDTWYVGGTNDYLLMSSYFLMTLSIFSIGSIYYKIKKS